MPDYRTNDLNAYDPMTRVYLNLVDALVEFSDKVDPIVTEADRKEAAYKFAARFMEENGIAPGRIRL